MNKNQGITLIELLASITIVTTLVFIAVPNIVNISARQSLTSATRTLMLDLHYAREAALKGYVHISLCPSTDGINCESQWRHSYMIYVDQNGNSKQDKSETQVLRFNRIDHQWQLDWRAFRGKNQLTFTPKGSTKNQNGSYRICPTNDIQLGRMIHINKAGRSRVADDTDGDGFSETASGEPMTCGG